MNQANKAAQDEQMRAEYDIRGGVRGKYYERYRQGTNIVVLEPAVYPSRTGYRRWNRGRV
jgi:hypothetical protein